VCTALKPTPPAGRERGGDQLALILGNARHVEHGGVVEVHPPRGLTGEHLADPALVQQAAQRADERRGQLVVALERPLVISGDPDAAGGGFQEFDEVAEHRLARVVFVEHGECDAEDRVLVI